MHRPKTLTRTFLFLSGLLLASSLARADGPSLVKDIVPGPTGSNPFYLTSVGERVVFWTYDYSSPTYPYYAYHLWASDGTDAGTVKLADVGYYTAFQQFSGDVYVFTAYDYSTSTYQKWRTDGTPAGTYKLFDGTINFQLLVGGVRIGWGSVYNSTTSTYAYSLWRTDGTLAGTQLLQSFSSGESPSVVSMLGDILIFQTTKYNSATSNYDTSLWRTDGTAGGTTLLRTAQGSIASATVLGSTLVYWFYTYAGGTYQYAIWRTDGTAAGTFLLKSTGSSGVNSRKPAFENALYFFVKTGSTGVELWRTDGSTGGTTLLKSAVGTNFAFLAPAFGNALLYTVYS
jgi:ELWxxDGT repeat protein